MAKPSILETVEAFRPKPTRLMQINSRRQSPLLKEDFEDLLAKRDKLLMKPIERKTSNRRVNF